MLEREVKLGAGPGFHLPDLAGVADGIAVAPPETLRLETVYYDTPDLRLARWGVSLRRRAGEGWTLKLSPSKSGALLERDELTFEGSGKKPPERALPISRRSTSAPWARGRSSRRRSRPRRSTPARRRATSSAAPWRNRSPACCTTTRWCAQDATPRPCTRHEWPPGSFAPTCAPSAPS